MLFDRAAPIIDAAMRWIHDQRKSLNLPKQVGVTRQAGAQGERTTVEIDHRIPPSEGAPRGWRITTKRQRLFEAHFGSEIRDRAKRATASGRGRAIYCIDFELNEVVALLTYHLDENVQHPLLLTAIGYRADAEEGTTLADRSRAGACLLKQYAHEIAAKTGRGGCVDIVEDRPDLTEELKALGFRTAPRLKGVRPSGRRWRQDALS